MFREKYQTFIYKKYEILEETDKITLKFYYEIENLENFEHTIQILKKDFIWKNLQTNLFKNMVFNLGMVEAISYYKATISPNFIIDCGSIEKSEENWLRKLFYLGLGEFRYINEIKISEENFVKFFSNGERLELENPKKYNNNLNRNFSANRWRKRFLCNIRTS